MIRMALEACGSSGTELAVKLDRTTLPSVLHTVLPVQRVTALFG
jgi:hypothetical protein